LSLKSLSTFGLHHLYFEADADTATDDTGGPRQTKILENSADENLNDDSHDVGVAVMSEAIDDPMQNLDNTEHSQNQDETLPAVNEEPKMYKVLNPTTKTRGKKTKTVGSNGEPVRRRNRTAPFYQPKKCEECGKVLSNQGKLNDHILTVHRREGRHKCELCDYNTQFPAALKSHMTSRHSDAKNFTCDRCDKSFKRIDQLRAHQQTHQNILITKKTKNSNISRKVPEVFPPDIGEELVPKQRKTPSDSDSTQKSRYYQSKMCQECGKVLSNLAIWRNHILTVHRGEGKYKCELCDYTCQFPAKLKIHMDTHHSETKKFTCDLCQKSFNRKDVLNVHKKSHEGNTPFQCKFCSAKFVHSGSLQKHINNRVCLKLKSEVEDDE